MKFILPRAIFGNRGDLASRWGVIAALQQHGIKDAVVFRKFAGDIQKEGCISLPYGKARNILLPPSYWKIFNRKNAILWSVGLDLQDDSSLAKLAYLWFVFSLYRLLGMKVYCLFQGAGPLRTGTGRWLASKALSRVELFAARDPGTYQLIQSLSPQTKTILAHDAIFLPGFEQEIAGLSHQDKQVINGYLGNKQDGLVIGINIRQWFHLASRVLPYQLDKNSYQKQSQEKMDLLISSMQALIKEIRSKLNARVLLISAYQPGVVEWEDDLPWLQQLSNRFPDDTGVVLTDQPLSMPQYYYLMSGLDIMIGMRLHSTLIALRMGVPSINISYTLKGRDILEYMGLGKNVVDLDEFLSHPGSAIDRLSTMVTNLEKERIEVANKTFHSIQENMQILSSFLQDCSGGL